MLFYVNGSMEKNAILPIMERVIIIISESGKVNILSGNVWMSEMGLVELFGRMTSTLRAAIRTIYKSRILIPTTTQRCDLAIPAS